MRVILAPRTTREFESLPKPAARRIATALERLSKAPHAPSPNIKALVGRKPWRRLRVGSHRVLFRISPDGTNLWVGRIIDRKDLERAVGTLPD